MSSSLESVQAESNATTQITRAHMAADYMLSISHALALVRRCDDDTVREDRRHQPRTAAPAARATAVGPGGSVDGGWLAHVRHVAVRALGGYRGRCGDRRRRGDFVEGAA